MPAGTDVNVSHLCREIDFVPTPIHVDSPETSTEAPYTTDEVTNATITTVSTTTTTHAPTTTTSKTTSTPSTASDRNILSRGVVLLAIVGLVYSTVFHA